MSLPKLPVPVLPKSLRSRNAAHLLSDGTSVAYATGPDDWAANGSPRPPFSVEDHPQLDEEDPDDPTDSDSDSATVVHAHFVVLKYDFTPELVTVPLALPCTQPEALGQVQLGRDPFIRSAFPLLLEVSPQPCSGQAVCIGAPAWSPQPGVCIDTIAVDRRIFVAYAPTYVSRQDLISLADLPEALELEVWIGGNELLRDDDPPVHVYPGVLIRFSALRDATP